MYSLEDEINKYLFKQKVFTVILLLGKVQYMGNFCVHNGRHEVKQSYYILRNEPNNLMAESDLITYYIKKYLIIPDYLKHIKW